MNRIKVTFNTQKIKILPNTNRIRNLVHLNRIKTLADTKKIKIYTYLSRLKPLVLNPECYSGKNQLNTCNTQYSGDIVKPINF